MKYPCCFLLLQGSQCSSTACVLGSARPWVSLSWVTISATVLALTGQELLGHWLLFGEHRASVHGELPLESERESQLPQAGTQELFGAPLCPLPCSLAALILFWGGDAPFVGRLSSLLWDSCHSRDTQPLLASQGLLQTLTFHPCLHQLPAQAHYFQRG